MQEARSLGLLAAGALAGLGLAAIGLFDATAAPAEAVAVPPGALARVNDGLILRSDFAAQLEAEHGVTPDAATPAQRQAVLEAMLAEELLVQRGLEVGLPASHPAVREALVAAVQEQIAADAQARTIEEAALRERWQRDASRYASEPRLGLHLLSATPTPEEPLAALASRVEAAAAALRAGEPAGEVAARFGLQADPRLDGTPQPEAAILRLLAPSLHAAARAIAPGEVPAPIAANGALHLLRGGAREPARLLPFETVRTRVLADARREAREALYAEYLRFLRARATILLAEGAAP
ncbi:peptidylprolyl isomerase [Falsiroseomonas ponticola]|uniref:peptidylprolyl isomerase n=1 Tax=Falsiroseomonas ponticola TaxID=2786951 RepID=UPI0019320A38|nr:hypothetical protein [Roseomonas ponticola]